MESTDANHQIHKDKDERKFHPIIMYNPHSMSIILKTDKTHAFSPWIQL